MKNQAYADLKEAINTQKKTRFLYVPSALSYHIDMAKPDGTLAKFMAPVAGKITDIHIYVGVMTQVPIEVSLIGVDSKGTGSYAELSLNKGHNEFNENHIMLGDGSRIELKLKKKEECSFIGDVYLGFMFHPNPESFGKQIRVEE